MGSSTRLSAIVKVKQIRPITATLSRPSAALSGNLAYGLSDLPGTDDVKDENHRWPQSCVRIAKAVSDIMDFVNWILLSLAGICFALLLFLLWLGSGK
jgi:hypothetical protein